MMKLHLIRGNSYTAMTIEHLNQIVIKELITTANKLIVKDKVNSILDRHNMSIAGKIKKTYSDDTNSVWHADLKVKNVEQCIGCEYYDGTTQCTRHDVTSYSNDCLGYAPKGICNKCIHWNYDNHCNYHDVVSEWDDSCDNFDVGVQYDD